MGGLFLLREILLTHVIIGEVQTQELGCNTIYNMVNNQSTITECNVLRGLSSSSSSSEAKEEEAGAGAGAANERDNNAQQQQRSLQRRNNNNNNINQQQKLQIG